MVIAGLLLCSADGCCEAKLQAFRVACRIGRLRLSKQLHTAASRDCRAAWKVGTVVNKAELKTEDAQTIGIDAAAVSETLQEACMFEAS